MVRNIENGLALIEKWLRNKNTIEFLGIWEEMYNPDFYSPEFEGIKNEAGLTALYYQSSSGQRKRIPEVLLQKLDDTEEHMHTKRLLLNLHHGYLLSSSCI